MWLSWQVGAVLLGMNCHRAGIGSAYSEDGVANLRPRGVANLRPLGVANLGYKQEPLLKQDPLVTMGPHEVGDQVTILKR